MKHQWSRSPETGNARCLACGAMAVAVDHHYGAAVVTEDCPEGRVSMISAELDSTPTLVQIDEDLWVNPATVSRLSAVGSDIEVGLVNGEVVHVMQSLSGVVALINGSA